MVKEEAEQQKLTSTAAITPTAAAVTSSSGASSTSVKDLIAPIPEEPAAEAAEAAGTMAEGEAARQAGCHLRCYMAGSWL